MAIPSDEEKYYYSHFDEECERQDKYVKSLNKKKSKNKSNK